jgi:hypothetical protein
VSPWTRGERSPPAADAPGADGVGDGPDGAAGGAWASEARGGVSRSPPTGVEAGGLFGAEPVGAGDGPGDPVDGPGAGDDVPVVGGGFGLLSVVVVVAGGVVVVVIGAVDVVVTGRDVVVVGGAVVVVVGAAVVVVVGTAVVVVVGGAVVVVVGAVVVVDTAVVEVVVGAAVVVVVSPVGGSDGGGVVSGDWQSAGGAFGSGGGWFGSVGQTAAPAVSVANGPDRTPPEPIAPTSTTPVMRATLMRRWAADVDTGISDPKLRGRPGGMGRRTGSGRRPMPGLRCHFGA